MEPDGNEPARRDERAPSDEELARFREWERQQAHWQQAPPPAPYHGPGQYQEQGQYRQQQPQDPGLREELAGVREQLSALQQSQAKVERATNPPLWRRVLRSWPVKLLAGLVVVLLAGFWAINHFFGPGDSSGDPQAKLPGSRPQVQQRVGMESPKDAVAQVYRDVGAAAASPASAGAYADNACLIFTERAARAFGRQLGAPDCKAAFSRIRVADPGAYQDVSLRALPRVPATARTTTIDSCTIDVSGGPRLGTFTLTQTGGDKWLITGVSPSRC